MIGVGMSFLFLVLICLALDRPLGDPWTYAKTLSLVATCDTALWLIFRKWLWYRSWFQGWLVTTPYVVGLWDGHITSNWIDKETNKPLAPIPATLRIAQTLTTTSCVMRTGEMKSGSFVAGFQVDPEHQKKDLCFSYESTPEASVRDRSPSHPGTARLELIEATVDGPMLIGEYWTARQTTGKLEFTLTERHPKNELLPCMGKHPMTKGNERV